MTLAELVTHFDRLFGQRDGLFFPGPLEQLQFLMVRISDLQDLIRKRESIPNPPYDIALRRIFVNLCSLTNFYRLRIEQCLAKKYPLSGCGYCRQQPCTCSESDRAKHNGGIQTPEAYASQCSWSLRAWCDHLRTLYGNRGENRSLEMIALRLYREAGEISTAIAGIRTSPESNDVILEEIGLEIADALAWLIAAANELGVDLENAIWTQYGNGCQRCHQITCHCKPRHIQSANWHDPVASARSF